MYVFYPFSGLFSFIYTKIIRVRNAQKEIEMNTNKTHIKV